MIVQMSDFFLMGKYSPVGFRTLILYNIRYYWREICRDGHFILFVTFISLLYLKSNTKKVYKDLLSHKARTSYDTQIAKKT